MSAAKTILLVDGNNLFHRAYHALPPLTSKSGENANAVFGFSNMVIKAINEVRPDYIACAFDTKAPTFRHVEFEAYKAQRVTPPPDLYPQLPKVKSVLDAFGIKYFEKEGYEADDILATIATKLVNGSRLTGRSKFHGSVIASEDQSGRVEAKQSKVGIASSSSTPRNDEAKINIIILSGDRDLLQLVDGNIKVQVPGWNLKETTLFGAKEVKEKYGLAPHQMVDYKSMTGDPSDNVPGVGGVGPKTASALLQKYHTLEGIYSNLAEISETTRVKLEKDKDVALAAKKLVALDTDVDISFQFSKLRFMPDWEKVRAEYERLGFRSIISKLPGARDQRPGVEAKSKEKKENSDQLELI